MEGLYAGSDLHGNSNFLGIIDAQGKRVFKRKMPNELGLIRETLGPFRGELVGIAVESTYNWYWLVDGLMEEGYRTLRIDERSLLDPTWVENSCGCSNELLQSSFSQPHY